MTVRHLDTDFLIRALVAGTHEDRQLRHWLRDRAAVRLSAVAWAELLCGPIGDTERQLVREIVGTPVALTDRDAETAAALFTVGGRRRGSLSDCLIAATAMRANATLVTGNAADYRRFESAGLQLETVPARR